MTSTPLLQFPLQRHQQGMASHFGHDPAPDNPTLMADLFPGGKAQETIDRFHIASGHEHRSYNRCFNELKFLIGRSEPVFASPVHVFPLFSREGYYTEGGQNCNKSFFRKIATNCSDQFQEPVSVPFRDCGGAGWGCAPGPIRGPATIHCPPAYGLRIVK